MDMGVDMDVGFFVILLLILLIFTYSMGLLPVLDNNNIIPVRDYFPFNYYRPYDYHRRHHG